MKVSNRDFISIVIVIALTGLWTMFLYLQNLPVPSDKINWVEAVTHFIKILVVVVLLYSNFAYCPVGKRLQYILFFGLSLWIVALSHDILDEFIVDTKLTSLISNVLSIVGFLIIAGTLFQWMKTYEQKINYLKHKRKEITEESYRDGLTGLYNRKFLNDILLEDTKNSIKERRSCLVMMIDIDNFKHFNDTYGHLEGDKVIKACGKTISRCVRTEDVVVRLGGEEFVVLVYGNRENSENIAKRIVSEFSDRKFIIDGNEVRKTISVGVAQINKDNSFEQLQGAFSSALATS